MTNNTVYNVQFSRKVAPRQFQSLPYCKRNSQFLEKCHFQYSDLNDLEYIQLCKFLVEIKNCYDTYRNDVGNFSKLFRIRVKPDTKLKTRDLPKFPLKIGNI